MRLGLLVLGIFISIRNMGEIVYWLLQQFGPKTYRPNDFGLKDLDNNAIYIIYQLFAIINVTIGLTLMAVIIFYLK